MVVNKRKTHLRHWPKLGKRAMRIMPLICLVLIPKVILKHNHILITIWMNQILSSNFHNFNSSSYSKLHEHQSVLLFTLGTQNETNGGGMLAVAEFPRTSLK